MNGYSDRESGISVYLGCYHLDSPARSLRQLLGTDPGEIEKMARQRYGYDLKTFSKL